MMYSDSVYRDGQNQVNIPYFYFKIYYMVY